MPKTKTKIDDWTTSGEKQRIITPIIETIMLECYDNKPLMIEKVREEILKCTKEDDFVKAAIIIDTLYNYYPHLDLKDFHFVPLDWVIGDHYSLFDISTGPEYHNGKFGSKLASYFDEHPEYLGDPLPEALLVGDITQEAT